MMKRLLFTALSTLLFTGVSQSQVVINEYCAANMSGFTDSYGENHDWIELFNTTGSAVDLTGWHLSDRAGNPTKWQIPSGSVPANGHLVIVFSGRGTVNGNEIHPALKLTQTKPEDIVIANASGTVVDQLTMTNHQLEHSVGRTTDNATTWSYFDVPTPSASNTGGYDSYATTPVYDQTPGYKSGTINLNITSPDANVTLYYTTDGSTPTVASTQVTGPISVATTTVVRARAFSSDPNVLPSFVETNTYFINTTHSVPIISVCGTDLADLIEQGNGFNSQYEGAFEIFGASGTLIDEGEGNYNKHGNDSWAYDQRGFDFIMRDQFGYNYAIKSQLFGTKPRNEFQRLIIKAAANDNYPFENGAHIRDAFVHHLSQVDDLKLDERSYEPCIVYLDGRYWGVYEYREKIDDKDWTKYYFNQDEQDLYFLKTWGPTWEEYSTPAGAAQAEWNALRAFIMANDMSLPANFDNYVDTIFNWKSLVDYFVLNSVIVSQDWLNWNTAWWRGLNEAGNHTKWRYTLWDMDASFGHYINYTGIPDPSANADPCDPESLPDPGGQGHVEILTKLMENPVVDQYYKSRFIDLMNTTFSCDRMITVLDDLINTITPEMTGQVNRWGGTVAGWQANVQTLKDFINTRCTALVQGMIDCYTLSGPYDVTFDVSPAGAGTIKVNSIWLDQYPWTGTYFGGIDVLLKAQAEIGFEFSHWEIADPVTPSQDSTDVSTQFTQQQTVIAHFKEEEIPDQVWVPTAFSPNDDNNNDVWIINIGEDVTGINVKVLNRWGELMYEFDDPAAGWDGSYKGERLHAGVYTYIISASYSNGKTFTWGGNVTLVR